MGDNGSFDTIVIGSGVGGLTAALSLARDGRDVMVLEAGKQFGGMLNPFARKKYHFDVGIHYVGECGKGQAGRRILDRLGLEHVRFREINPDCIDRYVFDGYEAKLVKGLDRWQDVLIADFPHERRNIERFIDLMRSAKVLQRASQGRITGPGAAQALRRLPTLLKTLHVSFADLLEQSFDDPVLRCVFAGPGGDIGVPPSKASALVSILVLLHFLSGGYYPIGGSGAMRDGYVDGLLSNGATLYRNRLVNRIEVLSNGRFAVYTNRDERFEARSVVSNVDATHTMEMLDGAKPGFLVGRRAKRFRPSLGSFCLFVGTDLDPAKFGLSDANVWHYGSNDLEAGYRPAYNNRFNENPFFFLTVPTLKDPETKRAPKGHHTVELITFVPSGPFKPWFDKPAMKRGPAYQALKDELTETLLRSAEIYMPGLRDHVKVMEAATPATVWHFVRGREGGIYGPEHSPDQMFHRRLTPSTGIDGLYLTGSSVLGAGILTCMTSGVLAAGMCRKHLSATKTML